MDLEGKLIGNRYEILEIIGKGGMATVYKAKDTMLKRYVAVKVLKEEFTTDEEFIKRFNTEAQSAASLTHPNIVSIYDVGTENNIYYIVMELIQGKTLKEIINEDGILPWKWALNVAIQIASALEVAHKNNIVHRDIKPHNIIITEDGVAKVTDFGIAKAVSNSTITAFGTTIGSVHYFSPEHARGGYTDAKSDLYSLGVVMYEMLTGQVPFDADTAVSVALKHMQEKPVEPIKLNPSIPTSVNKIIMKAMEKDVNLRYQSATEMLEDLNKALKDPDGDFVTTSSNDMETQRVEIPEESEDEKKEKKKEGKVRKFFKKHPALKVILIILLIILIPVIFFFAAQAILNWDTVSDVQIPNFADMTLEEAQTTAEEAGLELSVTEDYSSDVEEGLVMSQDPAYLDGYTVKEGSTVNLVISLGENVKTVPKVTGENVNSATEKLEEQELKIEVVQQSSNTVESGIIISQDPEANTEVSAGSTVTVYVSTGAKQITAVNVVGSTASDAESRLEKLGFNVDIEYDEDKSEDDGVVLSQSISSGTSVNDGSTITITVNKVEEDKTAKVTINVKSITGGYEETSDETDDSTTTTVAKDVQIVLKVDGSTVYTDSGVDKNTTSKTTQITGTGSVTLTLTITDSDGGNWTRTETVNFDTTSSVSFE